MLGHLRRREHDRRALLGRPDRVAPTADAASCSGWSAVWVEAGTTSARRSSSRSVMRGLRTGPAWAPVKRRPDAVRCMLSESSLAVQRHRREHWIRGFCGRHDATPGCGSRWSSRCDSPMLDNGIKVVSRVIDSRRRLSCRSIISAAGAAARDATVGVPGVTELRPGERYGERGRRCPSGCRAGLQVLV